MVESLVTGNDGLVRSPNILTKSGVTNRPVVKLFPLEVYDREVVQTESTEGDQGDHNTAEIGQSSDDPTTEERPRCSAAQTARNQLAEWVKIIQPLPGGC